MASVVVFFFFLSFADHKDSPAVPAHGQSSCPLHGSSRGDVELGQQKRECVCVCVWGGGGG